jgi:3-oxoacyl-[acyl-carrier-protein] synthase III
LQGVALAAQWLAAGTVDGCIVVGAEECDWLTSDAFRLFSKQLVLSDGAGAIYLRKEASAATLAELTAVTDAHNFHDSAGRTEAATQVRRQVPATNGRSLLCDGRQNVHRVDAAEEHAWKDWSSARISPKEILGEGLLAAAAWQTVLAIDAIATSGYTDAIVSIVGCNQQAIAAQFSFPNPQQ